MGIILPTTKGDTAVLISDTIGSVNPTTAWANSSGGWISFESGFTNPFSVRLAISPIMCQVTEGVNEISNKETVNVYPNPAQNLLNVVFNSPQSTVHSPQSIDLRLFDLYGKVIKELRKQI